MYKIHFICFKGDMNACKSLSVNILMNLHIEKLLLSIVKILKST